jgi:hypothetical protein
MRYRFIFIYIVALSIWSCSRDEGPVASDVLDYLNRLVDIMEDNSIMRDQINWTDFRNKVLEKAGTFQPSAQKWEGAREALTLLGDNHSHFVTASGRSIFGDYGLVCEAENTLPAIIPEHIGYVQVFHFTGSSNSKAAIDFAQNIQDQIRSKDDSGLVGWIVDLRGNRGGNMWPMLAGIGPILGEGTVGYFVNARGGTSSWRYIDGASFIGGTRITKVEDEYELISPNPRVAVLLNEKVVSSGEAIAISFIGRSDTRSFGTATCGLSTANSGYKLRDQSTLYLAVANMADRNLNVYGNQILPDVEANAGDIINKAVEWIENQ